MSELASHSRPQDGPARLVAFLMLLVAAAAIALVGVAPGEGAADGAATGAAEATATSAALASNGALASNAAVASNAALVSGAWLAARLAGLMVVFGVIRYAFFRRIDSPTASGAIVMASGIFINGALHRMPFLDRFAAGFTVVLVAVLCFVAWSYLKTAVRGTLVETHLANPIGRFAVGTWIAGISVCAIAVVTRIPAWTPVVQVVLVANGLLWLFYIARAIGGFTKLTRAEFATKPHGVLLLSTVSTQSLVIAAKVAFVGQAAPPVWYTVFARVMIGLGVLFYFVSFAFIIRRYIREGRGFDIDKSWFNTNCIVHGAMSITGLASAVSGVVAPDAVLAIWLWVIFWFIVVEVVEIIRGSVRVGRHGFLAGLASYDATQWSRNFTFGMFFAFTLNFRIGESSAAAWLGTFRDGYLALFGWVVLGLLVIEIVIFLRDRYRRSSMPIVSSTSV